MSDFLDKGFEDAIKIANKKHDLIAVNVFDERETEIPDMGMIRVKNAETGQRMWVDSSSRRVRNIFSERSQNQVRYLNDTFRRSGVDVVKIRTDQDYVKPLIGLFRKRSARK
jgi:hypothetical protein